MIDLRRLQVLRMVQHHGTVTAAARSMYLTPSAVSQQLRQLSAEVGLALVEPQGRRIQLTPAAHALLEHADDLHAEWERIQGDLRSYAVGESGRLRIGSFPTALAALAAPAAARLAVEAPRLTVQLTEVESPDAFDRLLAGSIDLAIVDPGSGQTSPDDPKFEQAPLLDERQDALLPCAHELARYETLELADLRHESWILPEPGSCEQQQIVTVAAGAAGFAPRIAHYSTEWSTTAALVAAGLGVCLLPRMVELPAKYAVTRVPLSGEPQPSRRLLTFIRRGSRQQPAIVKGLDALRAVAAEHTQDAVATAS